MRYQRLMATITPSKSKSTTTTANSSGTEATPTPKKRGRQSASASTANGSVKKRKTKASFFSSDNEEEEEDGAEAQVDAKVQFQVGVEGVDDPFISFTPSSSSAKAQVEKSGGVGIKSEANGEKAKKMIMMNSPKAKGFVEVVDLYGGMTDDEEVEVKERIKREVESEFQDVVGEKVKGGGVKGEVEDDSFDDFMDAREYLISEGAGHGVDEYDECEYEV